MAAAAAEALAAAVAEANFPKSAATGGGGECDGEKNRLPIIFFRGEGSGKQNKCTFDQRVRTFPRQRGYISSGGESGGKMSDNEIHGDYFRPGMPEVEEGRKYPMYRIVAW